MGSEFRKSATGVEFKSDQGAWLETLRYSSTISDRHQDDVVAALTVDTDRQTEEKRARGR